MKKNKILQEILIKKISPTSKPDELSLENWQIALRRQIAIEGSFRVKNIGDHPVFSTFTVTNPKTKRIYRVVIRGEKLGINYCSCPDFSVNTLGTCKHIERVLHKLRTKKKTRQILSEGYISRHSSVTLRYGACRRIYFCMGTEAGSQLRELVNRYFSADGSLTPHGFKHFDKFVEEANTLGDKIFYHEDAMWFIAQVRDADLRKERVENLFPDGHKSQVFNNIIKIDLYPYQKEGVLFAVKAGRCLIADDMGLGKTAQAIAASEIMAKCFGAEKALVICPTSLKHQWQNEIERFTDRSSTIIQGLITKRHAQYKKNSFFKITNYDVIHRDIPAIKDWDPDIIILDEAQRIKNWKTRMARSVKSLYSPYAIVLTGTPLENRLEELHSIVEFIDRHHLGPLFKFLNHHQVTDEAGKVTGYCRLNDLGESLKPILIRRKKEEVLTQLPGRIEKNYFVPITPEQHAIHEENKDIVAKIVSKWRRYRFLSEEDKQRLLRALQNMRMVSDNTYLIDQNTIFGSKINELETQLQEIFEDKRAKIVIFSQWMRMIELIAAMLDVHGWKYVWLHGGVPGHKRGDLIKTFKEDPECRVFLSTEAGGLGLNLQNASIVINMDLPWNPAVLEQRICRVHRLGQKQPVRVINFITEKSIEHGMLSLHSFKRSMFSGVLDEGENEVFLGTSRFNRFIQTVEKATENMPKGEAIPSPAEIRESVKDAETSIEEINEEAIQKEEENITAPADFVLDGNAIRDFLQKGASFLEKLSRQFSAAGGSGENKQLDNKPPLGIEVTKDEKTGQHILQIPIPNNETIKKLIQAGGVLFDIFQSDGKIK